MCLRRCCSGGCSRGIRPCAPTGTFGPPNPPILGGTRVGVVLGAAWVRRRVPAGGDGGSLRVVVIGDQPKTVFRCPGPPPVHWVPLVVENRT